MTDSSVTAYPLAWPHGWPRTKLPEKRQFRTTLSAALTVLRDEVRRLGGTGLVLSSNVTLGSERPRDAGVVAYFTRAGQQVAIPCDRWTTVEANVKAIANTIEAMRAIERWGAKHMVNAMFTGLAALPAPRRGWREMFDIQPNCIPTKEQIEAIRRSLAAKHHPDKGGDPALMAEINAAADAAIKEIGT